MVLSCIAKSGAVSESKEKPQSPKSDKKSKEIHAQIEKEVDDKTFTEVTACLNRQVVAAYRNTDFQDVKENFSRRDIDYSNVTEDNASTQNLNAVLAYAADLKFKYTARNGKARNSNFQSFNNNRERLDSSKSAKDGRVIYKMVHDLDDFKKLNK